MTNEQNTNAKAPLPNIPPAAIILALLYAAEVLVETAAELERELQQAQQGQPKDLTRII